jgi:serine/threonine protein kinase
MTMNSQSSSDPDPLGGILESFLARLRQGERPSLKEYADRYPELAKDIYGLLPAMVELEQQGPADEDRSGRAKNGPTSSRAISGVPAGGAGDRPRPHSHPLPSPGSHPIPERLGDYRIIRQIGGGGMGIVYEAERESLRSRVALKVMHPKFRSHADYLRWFLREARSAAALHHTNIVSVFDYGEHDGICYYAMQYIAGHSLARVFEDVKRLKRDADRTGVGAGAGNGIEPEAICMGQGFPTRMLSGADSGVRSVSLGLLRGAFPSVPRPPTGSDGATASRPAHDLDATQPDPGHVDQTGETHLPSHDLHENESGLPASSSISELSGSSWSGRSSVRYHREIARIGAQVADALDHAHKRGVIHRDIKPHNILLDGLGNAWITDFGLAKLKQREGQDAESTAQAFAGTLRFMAPERFQGKSDGRDDIYALGVTLYEFLALRPIFEDSDPHQLLRQIEHEQPTPLRQIDRQVVHPDLAAIVARALAKDPAERYASAAELRDELRRFIEGRPVKTRPVPSYARFWRWCKRNPWLAGANITAALLTTVLAIGSTIAAWVYSNQVDALELEHGQTKAAQAGLAAQLKRTQEAERNGRERLFESYLSQAQAKRVSRRMGQRFETLDALRQAADIGRELKLPPERFEPLRDEAIACLALPDLKPTGRVITRPPSVVGFTYDSTMSRYALRFRDGTISVRRFVDDQEIARFQGRGDRDIWVFGFSPDGRYLATTHVPGSILAVWDIDRRAVSLDGLDTVGRATFSPDSGRIIVNQRAKLLEFDLATGRFNRTWPGRGHYEAIRPDWG